ncbi:MAG: GntR family transcriptional regulator [Parerythrobacter sp.]
MQVAGELREAIGAGRFAGGAQFPTETVLCETYDVSRFTIREALKRLQAEGLIARKRGSGTTVQPAAARGGALHQPMSNVGELLQYARDSKAHFARRERGPLPRGIAEQIDGDTAGEWLRFNGVRRVPSDRLPIAHTDAYFHERLGDALDRLSLDDGTLFTQIERLAGLRIGQVTQDIQAVAATRLVSDKLEVNRGSPVLRILRCYYDQAGTLFEISVSHHPGDRFAYAMHIDLDV